MYMRLLAAAAGEGARPPSRDSMLHFLQLNIHPVVMTLTLPGCAPGVTTHVRHQENKRQVCVASNRAVPSHCLVLFLIMSRQGQIMST